MRRYLGIIVVALWALSSAPTAFAWSGKVVIHQQLEGDGSSSFDFHTTLPGAGTFSLGSGDSETRRVHPGTYEVTQDSTGGYELRDLYCVESKRADSETDLQDRRASIVVQKDETVECTFVNGRAAVRRPTPPPPPPPPPPAPAAPAAGADEGPVPAAPPAVRGTAKLRAPTGCVSTRRPARATVTGTEISSVTFWLDGRRVRRLTSAAATGGQWSLRLSPRSLRRGTHRVRAVVAFHEISETKTRALNVAFARCATKASTPKFTG
jgi:hypothetical protein